MTAALAFHPAPSPDGSHPPPQPARTGRFYPAVRHRVCVLRHEHCGGMISPFRQLSRGNARRVSCVEAPRLHYRHPSAVCVATSVWASSPPPPFPFFQPRCPPGCPTRANAEGELGWACAKRLRCTVGVAATTAAMDGGRWVVRRDRAASVVVATRGGPWRSIGWRSTRRVSHGRQAAWRSVSVASLLHRFDATRLTQGDAELLLSADGHRRNARGLLRVNLFLEFL